mgnify:CR=1 FL=1
MTKKVEKEFLKRIEKAKLNNIFVQEEIKINSHIRGVYGFFAKKRDSFFQDANRLALAELKEIVKHIAVYHGTR